MKEVFLVSSENKGRAERLLRDDDAVSRGSIKIKEPASLDIEEEGVFIILDAPEEALKKAGELLKDIAKKYPEKDRIIKKIEEQENTAAEGFGNILG